MKTETTVTSIGLRVFARAAAAVSHEIKNTLSIINENAGLLDDLAAMAEADGGVAPQRVQAAAATIMKQVDRSNVIMKNLNRFAHSADSPVLQADLGETLSLIAALTSRQAAMKNITVAVNCPVPCAVTTYLFSLESLLYLLLLAVYDGADSGSALVLEAETGPRQVTLRFLINGRPGRVNPLLPDGDQMLLAEQIQGSCLSGENGLSLGFPTDITGR